MRIAVISTCVFPMPPVGYSGLEMIAWQQAEGLAERGYDVTLFGAEGSQTDKANLRTLGPVGSWDEHRAYDACWKELLAYDVVLDHTWQKWSLILKEEGRLKAPVLCWLHAPVDTMYRELPNVEKPCFVAISEDQASHFRALHSRDVRVCKHGIDTEYYRHLGCRRSGRFLFLARFSRIKGPVLAIDACRKVGVGLDLVGDTSITNEPDYLEECKAKVVGFNLNNVHHSGNWKSDVPQFRLVGPVTRGQCVHWFSQAHALLHPNKLFREPLGLAPLESQACGTPVVAWRRGAMSETVKHGETGFLVDSFDGFVTAVEMLRDKSEHDMTVMCANCREWVTTFFPLKSMTDRCCELIDEAMSTGGW